VHLPLMRAFRVSTCAVDSGWVGLRHTEIVLTVASFRTWRGWHVSRCAAPNHQRHLRRHCPQDGTAGRSSPPL